MTGIDESKVPGAVEIHRRYRDLLRKAEQNEEGRLAAVRDLRPGEKSRAGLNSEEMKMAQACRDFEALFIQQLLSEMRRGLREDSVLGAEGGSLAADRNRSSFFRDRMYQDISEDMANQGGFGVGSVLFEQLYRQEHPDVLPGGSRVSSSESVPPPSAGTDSVHKLLEQQRHTMEQQRSLSRAQLGDRFYR
ncbi:rod-binding protein [Candidatus Haliotispira prima]|uniref:Rod-binding protein n=1 Tax=Candidatus Haliotispira prima TaxID=3034016 RepID=A0ABY8MFM2_9SPIO|nr:rod-binding protein [Candidatus Haliotispira prima]